MKWDMEHAAMQALHAKNEHLQAENERLRGALKGCRCPAGGWNGMPNDMEPTIENCMEHSGCGCCYGDLLRDTHPSGKRHDEA